MSAPLSRNLASGKHSIKNLQAKGFWVLGKQACLGWARLQGEFEGGQDTDQLLVSHRSDPLMNERAVSLGGWGVEAAPTASERQQRPRKALRLVGFCPRLSRTIFRTLSPPIQTEPKDGGGRPQSCPGTREGAKGQNGELLCYK